VNGSGETESLHAHFYVLITLCGKHCEKSIEAMLDSGTQGCFMHPQFVKENGVVMHALKRPISLGNIDGSPNRSGSITHYTVLGVIIDGHLTKAFFHIANISREDAVTVFLRPLSPCDLVCAESKLATRATPFCPSLLHHKRHGANWAPNIRCSNHIGCCVARTFCLPQSVFSRSLRSVFHMLVTSMVLSLFSSGLQSNGLGLP
jgi:hypothetical protein